MRMPTMTTKLMVALDDGAVKSSEPHNTIATITPSMTQCSQNA